MPKFSAYFRLLSSVDANRKKLPQREMLNREANIKAMGETLKKHCKQGDFKLVKSQWKTKMLQALDQIVKTHQM